MLNWLQAVAMLPLWLAYALAAITGEACGLFNVGAEVDLAPSPGDLIK